MPQSHMAEEVIRCMRAYRILTTRTSRIRSNLITSARNKDVVLDAGLVPKIKDPVQRSGFGVWGLQECLGGGSKNHDGTPGRLEGSGCRGFSELDTPKRSLSSTLCAPWPIPGLLPFRR